MFESESNDIDNDQLQEAIEQVFDRHPQKAKSVSSKGNYKVNLSSDLIKLGIL